MIKLYSHHSKAHPIPSILIYHMPSGPPAHCAEICHLRADRIIENLPSLHSGQKASTTTMAKASPVSARPGKSKTLKLCNSGFLVMLSQGAKANGRLSHGLIESVMAKYGYWSSMRANFPFMTLLMRMLTGRILQKALLGG